MFGLLILVFLVTTVIVMAGVAIHTTFVMIKNMPENPKDADLEWLIEKLGKTYFRRVVLLFVLTYMTTLATFALVPQA